MKSYEIMYIVKPVEEDAYKVIIDKFEKLIADNGGIVEKTDDWGKKRLSCEVQGFYEGLYVITTFRADVPAIKELDRVMKITDDVLRHMIIRKSEF